MEIFYSANIDGCTVVLPKEESEHCVRVLRHRAGDVVMVCPGDGCMYRSQIVVPDPKGTVLQVLSVERGMGLHDYFLHLAVAPPKNIDRFEWFLEKATEMGIDRVTPLLCEHSERKVIKNEREDKVILSAAKQSLKSVLPCLDEMTPFPDFIAAAGAFEGMKFIAYCDHELVNSAGEAVARIDINEALRRAQCASSSGDRLFSALFLIGPEGDFSMKEILMAADAGFLPVSLGEARLRTETAALLVTAAANLMR